MRTAAAAENVTLAINNAYRPAEVAQANAARADNRRAVASFSSHTLGLAIDLNMSHGEVAFHRNVDTDPSRTWSTCTSRPCTSGCFSAASARAGFRTGASRGTGSTTRRGFRDSIAHSPVAPRPPQFRRRRRLPPGSDAREKEEEGVSDPIAATTAAARHYGQRRPWRAKCGGRCAGACRPRLVELRVLEQSDAAAERPASGQPQRARCARTIEAIESFQRSMGTAVERQGRRHRPTRTDLDRAIPRRPPPTSRQSRPRETAHTRDGESRPDAHRAGRIDSSGNAPDDVRGVQRRLVDLGRLPASHRESPAAGVRRGVAGESARDNPGRCVPCKLTRDSGSSRRFDDRSDHAWRRGAWRWDRHVPRSGIRHTVHRIGSHADLVPRSRREQCHAERDRA